MRISSLATVTSPHTLFGAWFDEARAHEPDVPDAMQLATVADGRPQVRTVLLKAHGPDGFVFYTNYGSRKARAIEANPEVALVLHWKSLQRQVHVRGAAERVSREISDAYFATRERGSQLGAWASPQSTVLVDPRELQTAMAEVEARFAGREVPRPPHWGGYRVVHREIEFWQGKPDRLHDRVRFTRTNGAWVRNWIAP